MKTTTELATKCRREIEARLAVCEAATGEEWEHVNEIDYYAITVDGRELGYFGNSQNATFIAASRNERPAELRGWLAMLNRCETEIAKHKPTPEYTDSWQATRSDFAEIILRDIATALELEGK